MMQNPAMMQGQQFQMPYVVNPNSVFARMQGINPQKLSSDGQIMTQKVHNPPQGVILIVIVVMYIIFCGLNLAMPIEAQIGLTIACCMFVCFSVCMVYAYLSTPKRISVVSDRQNDLITLSYKLVTRQTIVVERRLSELVDVVHHRIESR